MFRLTVQLESILEANNSESCKLSSEQVKALLVLYVLSIFSVILAMLYCGFAIYL